MDIDNSPKLMEDSPTYELRSRRIIKRVDTPKRDKTETAEDMEVENSQESVSMLQECYQGSDFPETCMDSELEVIDIYSEESDVEDTQNRSTQTDPSYHYEPSEEKEREVSQHAQFINSIMNLKMMQKNRQELSCEVILDGQTVPKDAIGYVLRISDVQNVFKQSVQVLLQHLDDILRNDFLKIASCWKNSIYETVVELLTEAVDEDATVANMIVGFLTRTVDSILKDEKSKNLVLESKTNFVKAFCRSTQICYNIANCIVQNVKSLNEIKRQNDCSSRKRLLWVNLTKNCYFLLRLLESSLEFLKNKLQNERTEEVFVRKPPVKNYNVLEMWKKHWSRNEEVKEERPEHEWKTTINEWCEVLDGVLLHCVDHVPVLSIVVERCGGLAKDILQLCHRDLMEDRIKEA